MRLLVAWLLLTGVWASWLGYAIAHIHDPFPHGWGLVWYVIALLSAAGTIFIPARTMTRRR